MQQQQQQKNLVSKNRAKLTQPQRSCPRSNLLRVFTFSTVRSSGSTDSSVVGLSVFSPSKNDAKTWSDDTEKSPEHLFGNNDKRVGGFSGITRWKVWQGYVKREWGHSADPEGSHVDCVVLQVSSPDLHLLVSGNVTGSRPLPTNIRVLARAAKYSGLPRAERAQHPKHSCRIELSEFGHKLQITRGKYLFVVFESQHWSLF